MTKPIGYMTRPIGYYTVSDAAQAIALKYGFYAEKLTSEQIRVAIALCAGDSNSPMFADIEQAVVNYPSEYFNRDLVEILRSTSTDDCLELLPFFVEALRNR